MLATSGSDMKALYPAAELLRSAEWRLSAADRLDLYGASFRHLDEELTIVNTYNQNHPKSGRCHGTTAPCSMITFHEAEEDCNEHLEPSVATTFICTCFRAGYRLARR
jgi:hypothetical protein